MLATPFGRLDGLAIDTAGAGGWRPTGSPPDSTSEGVIDGLPGSVSFPRRKVVVDGPPWGKIVGQRSPDTAIAVAVEDGINHGPHLGLAWPPTDAGRRQEGLQDSPLLACQITGVWLWVHTLSTFETPFWNRLLRAVYLRVAGANNSIVRDARVFLASSWSRRRLIMGPYSMDLRERVAAAIDEGEGSERQIAKRFRVSVSFVTRLLQRRRDAGTLAPKPHGGGPRPVLGFPEQVRLAMLIAEHPDATLKQLKEWGGFACTLTTLRRFRLTYKKKTLHAGERDTPEVQAKRRRYRAKVRRIEAKRLVFVDETGVNTAMTPTHAWTRRGERAEGSVPSAWGSTTVIAALGLDGVRAPLIFPGATDTQAFQTYVDQVLVPELRPGDVVVFDNLKPHLSRHVAESIERAGATVLPLPPYSSDYDPIEELWSKFKGQLRRIAARTKDGLYKAVGETLDSVTIQDILGWFNHSGLYATHG